MSMVKIEYKNIEGFLLLVHFNHLKKPLVLEKETTSGFFAWIALALGIIAYDVYAIRSKKIETLTRAFWRLTEKQTHKLTLNGVWLILTFHLLIEKPLRKFLSEGVK